jgi:hypothetical protein
VVNEAAILPRARKPHCSILGDTNKAWYKASQISFQAYPRMNRGFYTIMAAQFFSSLADNALFVAIDLLVTMKSPGWITPLLKLSFTLFYVLLAAFVGAFADSMPKGKVMFISNLIKVGRLPADFRPCPSAAGLCRGRFRRGRVLAGQVRHPHRIAAPRNWWPPTAGSKA